MQLLSGSSVRTSFEQSLEQELFSKYVSLHLLAALAAVTGIGMSATHGERMFLLVVTSMCSLPPVIALLSPRWVQERVLGFWALTSGAILMLLVGAGHDVALVFASLLYGALGPLPRAWRPVSMAMSAVAWVASLWLSPAPVSFFLLLWCSIFSLWLSTVGFQRRRSAWLDLRLSLHQDRLLTQDLDAVSPGNARLDEPELVQEALRELESLLTTAEDAQREGLQRAVDGLRRALADTGAHVAPGFAARFRLTRVLDEAWSGAMTLTRCPIRLRVEVPADLEAYGDVPRVTALFRELLMHGSMSAAGETPRSLRVEAESADGVLHVLLVPSDDRALAPGTRHRLEVRAAEAGAKLDFSSSSISVRLVSMPT